MKNQIFNSRVALIIKTYILLVLFLLIQKPLFLLYHLNQSSQFEIGEWLNVIWKGLIMDFSIAGYLSLLPVILLIVSVYWMKGVKNSFKVYFLIISVVISIIFISDAVLYTYWGFRIDSTVFTYITSPKLAAASISVLEIIIITIVIAVWSAAQFLVLKKLVIDKLPAEAIKALKGRIIETLLLVVLIALSIIPIRGGVSTATLSPGSVYFSKSMFLNHAAINPIFNMMYSLKLNTDFDKQYRFMDSKEADAVFAGLMQYNVNDTVPELLKTERPNIVFIMLESFGKTVLDRPDVTPDLNRLKSEGVLFTNMYANSFRTDRGIVSVLGGYPAQPTMSILKYTDKTQTLNSIPQMLIRNGYNASFLYGGDLDFAQMKSFAITQGITDITDDKDFSVKHKLTKWGVPDAITFEKFGEDVLNKNKEPFLKIFLTLSSHEPFDVPTKLFEEPYLNSIHYTDECLGLFIDKLKQSPVWDNTLIVLVPDHDMRYPETIEYSSPERHDIFMLWLGGAVKQPEIISKVCSQIDIAPTLLNQMGIESNDFSFAKDILNPSSKGFAFYSFPNGFGMITDDSKVVFDCDRNQPVLSEGGNASLLEKQGKAFLQKLYDDIQAR